MHIFDLMTERFGNVDYNVYHLQKSLVWFEDAEMEPMPDMIRKVDWETIKADIVAAVTAL